MPGELWVVVLIAGSAATASLVGGLITLWRAPTPFYMSLTLGFASGVLIATITFEMLPQALELGGGLVAVAGFAVGYVAMYGLDLYVHHGQIAGERSEKHAKVLRFYRRRHVKSGEITVLAGGTSVEELVEGLAIGASAAIEPNLAILVAAAIAIDNVSESLSIGELIRASKQEERGKDQGNHEGKQDQQEQQDQGSDAQARARDDRRDGHRSSNSGPGGDEVRRILGWTGLIGAVVFTSAVAGWLLLRNAPDPLLAFLFATGAGGMLYLTVTELLPSGQERHYQQSAALATGAGFTVILIISQFL